LNALLRLTVAHRTTLLQNATHASQTALMVALNALLSHTTLELYPSITEHVFDVTTVMSDYIADDVRIYTARMESVKATDSPRCHFILGMAAPVDGWLVLTKPVNLVANPQPSSQPSTPITQGQASPYQSPQLTAATPASPHLRYFNSQQQQRQQVQQTQQAQQMRTYQQYPQHSMQANRQLPAQLQRTPSYQASPSPLQQMQHMQQMQQRAMQPSPVYTQRPTPAAGPAQVGTQAPPPGKLQIRQEREVRQYPFVQPRWEILAESSGNPSQNETAINLQLFGARKV
jgi:mediator of RNA polymerase II transcription subunit 12